MKSLKDHIAEIEQLIAEGREGKIPDYAANAMRGEVRFRDVGGYDRTYNLHRIMMATAMSDGKDGKAVDMDQSSWAEKFNVARPYSEEEMMMMKSAFATVDSEFEFNETDLRSMEQDDTNKTSVTAKPKKNRYGV
jgi:hypothetical protein